MKVLFFISKHYLTIYSYQLLENQIDHISCMFSLGFPWSSLQLAHKNTAVKPTVIKTHVSAPFFSPIHCNQRSKQLDTSVQVFGPLILYIVFPHTQSQDLNSTDELSSLPAQHYLKCSRYMGLRGAGGSSSVDFFLFKGYNEI